MNQDNFKGNERQLKLLLKCIKENDITKWNKFIKSNGKYFVANLEGINLSFLNLQEINLNGANLKNANFQSTDLSRAKLKRVKAMGADFSNSILAKSVVSDSYFQNTNFKKADLSGIRIKSTDMTDSNMEGANLTDASFINLSISSVKLNGAKIDGLKKSKSIKVKAKVSGHKLSTEDQKKLSPWKIAQKEELYRKIEREDREKKDLNEIIQTGLDARDKNNRYIVGEEE